ncbi:glutathione S-transferase family protein [Mesorhizobium sp.]|uniref:glutathione S-transferase family protein n=3 Tax=Mesorhizobium sp. TaxID=1871066 RepID=UPI000FE77514|nr:glutathione S-transferase family protein [Mesorhizobium sp.]RWD71979.1 MAG: glutathione S-transferase family protein [Mesorhizobium sp.]
MAGIVLYNYELDENCYKVRLALSMLGLEWEPIAVNAFPGNEQTTPPFLAMNPLGTLPILKDGDLTLFGAEAILAHLARANDTTGKWLPAEGADFAGVMQWLVFSAGALAVAGEARRNSLFDTPGDGEALQASAGKLLRIMDDHMIARGYEGLDWFAAGHPTIADIALFPAFALSRDFGIDHDEYAGLRRWGRRVRSLPGFVTMPGIPDYY